MFEKLFSNNQPELSADKLKQQEASEMPQQDRLRTEIINTLKEIYDPEIPVNIYDLGLIYDLSIDQHGHVLIRMTLTTAGCPVAQSFPEIVANRVRRVVGVEDVIIDIVWDPPWSQERISDAAKLKLGLL